MTPKPPGSSDHDDDDHGDDSRAFAEAVRGATPLPAGERGRRVPPVDSVRAPPPPARRVPSAGRTSDEVRAFEIQSAGDTMTARAPGVDARVARALRAGDYAVEATLDLHGCSRVEALAALERFVESARAQGRRAVLIVHGRGNRSATDGPVLRPAVWQWLTSSPLARGAVMALASAGPEHGGSGATLVLLRRRR